MAGYYRAGRYPYGKCIPNEDSWDMEIEGMTAAADRIRDTRRWLESFNPKSIELGEAIGNATDALMKLEKAIYGNIHSEYKEQIEKEES